MTPSASPSTVVREMQQRVRALGPVFNPDVLLATRAIYREHIATEQVSEQLDVPYGPHERHRLDVYMPAQRPRAVVVFVHGGGFIGGDKRDDGVFYANVGRFLANAGFAAVLINYRLAPAFGWPSAAHDVRDALAWVHAKGLGSDTGLPVFVWGQSAGASHVATWMFDDATRGCDLGSVAGVLLMSGYYHPSAPMSPNAQAYFGADPNSHERRSSVVQAKKCATPLWLSMAAFDPGDMAARSFELAQRISQLNGRPPSFVCFQDHNHVSTVLSLGSPQTDVGDAVLGFIHSVLSGDGS
ncbi:alpha/beta hydrolase [Hydrogenophaga sp. BPS33]|uniref:alpha/beta hydrolase n=1 Tax=Hydrogenophaga sp. BPS33 TaxID=2651974 RepID=UPI00131FDE37|nr:alpha/beta hydrolase [Hydrogenophaga sp. BPS33]QHE85504.1 alpha/beta hydrolase [Hydrogenophaga sp. BPS33]